MSVPRFRYAVLTGVVIGIVIPICVMTAFYLRILRIASEWLLFVWPTSIMLMATESLGYHSPEARGIVALSVAYNVVLYVFACVVIWSIVWMLAAWKASLRDGTTI